MVKATLLTFASAAFLLATTMVHADGMPADQVSETLQVESIDGKVLVRFTVDNQSDHPVYVPRSVAVNKELTGSVFEIKEGAKGTPIDYTGRMVKRGPITKNDYLLVEPHTTHRHTIDITGSYAFLPGRHTYQLVYAGTYLKDLTKVNRQVALKLEPASFTHVGK